MIRHQEAEIVFGMATAALGAGILEGKTAQGIRDATKIIGEQDKAQAQVQSDIAKLRVADAREREKAKHNAPRPC